MYHFSDHDLKDHPNKGRHSLLESFVLALIILVYVLTGYGFLVVGVACLSLAVLLEVTSAGADWLFSRHSGLVTCVLKNYSDVMGDFEYTFEHQEGDWMNKLKPRSYRAVTVENDIVIINTHLNAFGTDSHRAKQSQEIMDYIYRHNPGNVVICADMNEWDPNSKAIKTITRTLKGITSLDENAKTWSSKNPYSRASFWNWGGPWDVNIDWVFTDMNSLVGVNVMGTEFDHMGFLSDHSALFVFTSQ